MNNVKVTVVADPQDSATFGTVIKLTATVVNNGNPMEKHEVVWIRQLGESYLCTATGTMLDPPTRASSNTNTNGEAVMYMNAEEETVVTVLAVVTSPTQDFSPVVGDIHGYQIKGPPPKITEVKFTPGFADDGENRPTDQKSVTTISGKLLDSDNQPLDDGNLKLRISFGGGPPTATYQPWARWKALDKEDDPHAKDLPVVAGPDGTFTGEILAKSTSKMKVAVSVADEPDVEQTLDGRAEAIPAIQLEITQGTNVPANGTDQIIARARMVEKDDPTKPMAGQKLIFTLPADAAFTTDPSRDAVSENQFPATTDTKGYAEVRFTSKRKGSGPLKCESLANPVYSATTNYTFAGAWAMVGDIKFTFDGTPGGNASIYANGRQQAAVVLSFQVLDSNKKPLTADNGPPLSEIVAATQLQSFDRGTPLGSAELIDWKVVGQPNDYSKQFGSNGQRAEAVGGQVGHERERTTFPPDGKVVLFFYVSYSNELALNPLKLGYKIAPNGAENTYPPTIAGMGGDAVSLLISVLAPRRYNERTLKVVARHAPHADENDTGPAKPFVLTCPAGNYWRQWDYLVEVPPSAPGSPVMRSCTVAASDFANKFLRCRTQSGLYEWHLYVWPNNCVDEKANAYPALAALDLTVPNLDMVTVNCPVATAGVLGFTVCAYFTGVLQELTDVAPPLKMTVNDDYGNFGIVYVNSSLPTEYTGDALGNFVPLVDNAPSFRNKPPSKEPPRQVDDQINVFNLGTLALVRDEAPFLNLYAGGGLDDTDMLRFTGMGNYAQGASQFHLYTNFNPTSLPVNFRPYFFVNVSFPWFFLRVGTDRVLVVHSPPSDDMRFYLEPVWGKYPCITIKSYTKIKYLHNIAAGATEDMVTVQDYSASDLGCRWTYDEIECGHPPPVDLIVTPVAAR